MDTAKIAQTSTNVGDGTPKMMTSTETVKSFVVTLYVDALNADDIDAALGMASGDTAAFGVNFKNWVVDDDETPELHK